MCSFSLLSILLFIANLSFNSLFSCDLLLNCWFKLLTLSLCSLVSWLIFLLSICSVLVGSNWGTCGAPFCFSLVIALISDYFAAISFMRVEMISLCSLMGIIWIFMQLLNIDENMDQFAVRPALGAALLFLPDWVLQLSSYSRNVKAQTLERQQGSTQKSHISGRRFSQIRLLQKIACLRGNLQEIAQQHLHG